MPVMKPDVSSLKFSVDGSVSTGGILPSCTSMLLAATTLLLTPSDTWKLIEREATGVLSRVLTKVIARSAACHCATVARPPADVRVRMPVVGS